MKKILKVLLVLIIVGVAGLASFYFINKGAQIDFDSGNGVEQNKVPKVVTPESQMIQVPEEYYDSVNADITLEQLQNSKVVRNVQILNEGSPIAQAIMFIYYAEVIEISGRNLTLMKEGDTLSIYIGENADIRIATEIDKEAEFRDIRIGDFVNIGAILQIARDDPLWIGYLSILR